MHLLSFNVTLDNRDERLDHFSAISLRVKEKKGKF